MSIIETTVVPEKLVFSNGDFKIYSCSTIDPLIKKNAYGNNSIKGIMPRLDLGVEYKVALELDEINPKFGASYKCISIYQDIPETPEGQKEYLKTIMTELQLKAIYEVYTENDNIVELIKNKTFDYQKVNGFGPVVFERIHQKLLDTLEYKEILSKFGKYGITYETILKLAEELNGSRQLAVQILEENPYIITSVSGFGFKKADVIAKKMGVKHDDPNRIRYGIKYTIEEYQQNGHTYLLKDELLKNACDILQLDEYVIEKEILKTDGLKIIDNKIALQTTYNAEYLIAQKLKEMLTNNIELDFDVEDFVKRMEEKYGFKLTEQQRNFFNMIKMNRVGLLVGYAGVGKSFIQKLVVDLLDELKLTYTLLSPTGKAAKLLSGYTGRKAKTIHKAVGYGKEKKIRELITVEDDFIIVDEMSMTDCFILNMLLQKITNPNVRILFCGDPAQLAAVGAANLLHDFIESGVIPKTQLDKVFRQNEGGLLDVITKVRNGEKIIPNDFKGKKLFGKDFIFHSVPQNDIPKAYKHYYNFFLRESKPEDIAVISPTKKGQAGTVQINNYIQSIVNPETPNCVQHPYGDSIFFRVGDYVINTQNMYGIVDYDDNPIDIVNGDTGVIIDIVKNKDIKKLKDSEYVSERDKNGIVIKFDVGIVRFEFNEIGQLLHAWSMTGHRMQGSAADNTISIADRAHTFQLSRNQIYTMLSRTRKRGVLLTQAEVFNRALKIVDNKRRNTFMQDLLKNAD